MDRKILALLVQLGSPKSPSTGDVKAYLRDFLGNPRVVDLPSWFWKPFLTLVVLPLRSPKSARLYQHIWDGKEFPLTKYTDSFSRKVDEYCRDSLAVRPCYLLSPREPEQALSHWAQRAEEWDKILLVPQFPQYSDSTTASALDEWEKALANRQKTSPVEFIAFKNYHRLRSFIDLSAQKIDRAIENDPVDGLVISFHGLPLKNILQKGDPYYLHCRETFELLRERVQSLPREKMYCTFQSRFGRGEWLGPATDDFVCERISQKGDHKLAVYAPSFVADCLETRDELGRELQHLAKESGGEILLVDCLNDDDDWAKAYGDYLLALTEGNGQDLCYPAPDVDDPVAELKTKARWNPLDKTRKVHHQSGLSHPLSRPHWIFHYLSPLSGPGKILPGSRSGKFFAGSFFKFCGLGGTALFPTLFAPYHGGPLRSGHGLPVLPLAIYGLALLGGCLRSLGT